MQPAKLSDFLLDKKPEPRGHAGLAFSSPGSAEHQLAIENIRHRKNKLNRQPSPPSEMYIHDPESMAETNKPEEKPNNPYHYDLNLPELDDDPVVCSQLKEHFDGEPHTTTHSAFRPGKLIIPPDSFDVGLVENKRMTPLDHWQDVRQLTFVLSDENAYDPGDIVNIWPKNFPEDVQTLIDLQGWADVADKLVTFVPTAPDFYAADNLLSEVPGLFPPHDPTLRDLLIHNLDFTAIPNRFFFETISHSTNDPMHRERLLDFTNPAYTDEFYDYTSRPRRSILEVLQDFPSVKLPWQRVCHYFPLIRPRKFSICSGGTLKNRHLKGEMKFQLLVAIVKYKTVLKKVRQGLCSRYLAALPARTRLQISFSESKLGHDICRPDRPLILVGPGTGIAPCRSLIWERANYNIEGNVKHIADSILFYGGRNKEKDYFYENEWAFPHLRLTNVYTAFSRDQKEKIYVQDIIRQEKEEVWRLIESGAIIMVCGSSGKMPKAVREAIIWVMLDQGGEKGFPNGRADVEAKLKLMEKHKFYVQETW
jgi:sulfite reductase alpha subunit-like flavoprotein